MPSLYINTIGIIGMFVILLNTVLLEDGKETATSIKYLFLGFLGSVLLVLYSILTNSPIFIIINFIFAVLNIYWLSIVLRRKKIKKRTKRKRRR